MNIILIGYRCSGKTSVGNDLARRIGWPFVDTDDVLVRESGRSVKEIVRQDGWKGFRELEQAVIQTACGQDNTVIATGGGAVLDPANIGVMKRSGSVVWLKASVETIKERMFRDADTHGQRPPLTSSGAYGEISDVLKARLPCYDKAMDFSIDTDHKNRIEITDEIIKTLFGNGIPCKASSPAGDSRA